MEPPFFICIIRMLMFINNHMNRLGDLTKVINENPHWAALEI